jgi:hypothetical protein
MLVIEGVHFWVSSGHSSVGSLHLIQGAELTFHLYLFIPRGAV